MDNKDKPKFNDLPYGVRERLMDHFQLEYDGYEDSRDEQNARILGGYPYSSDTKQVENAYQYVDMDLIITYAIDYVKDLESQLEYTKEFLANAKRI